MAKLLVGIDIGTRYTKVVELEFKPKPRLINASFFPTPFISSQEINQLDTKPFLNEITNIIPLKRLHLAKIGINIPSALTTAILAILPRMPGKELFAAAINEAKRGMVPASGPNHTFECVLLGERIVAKAARSEVLVIRTENSYVQKIIDLFKEIDITPALITPSSSAILNILPNEAWSKEEDTVFVDLGFSSINISVSRQGKLFFTRNVSYGFKDILGDISRELSYSEADTERFIKESGVPQVPFDPKDKVAIAEEIMRQKYEAGAKSSMAEKPQVNPLELRMLWQPHIDRIIHELRRSFAYYKEESQGRRIGYIYFSGGSSQIKNLIPVLSSQIGGQCQVILPFKGLPALKEKQFEDEASSTPIFTNAASLTLTVISAGKKQPVINFLPVDLKRKEVVATRRLIILFAGICLLSVFSLVSLRLFLSNHSIRKSIESEEFQLSRVKRITSKLKDLSQREKDLQQLFSQVEGVIKERQKFQLPLEELAAIIPQEILLTSIKISAGDLESAQGTTAQGNHSGMPKGNAEPYEGIMPKGGGGLIPKTGPEPAQAIAPKGGSNGNTQAPYRIKINGDLVADYEEAMKIIEDFKKRLEATPYFTKVKIEPLKLEEISFQGVSKEARDLRLTARQSRTFNMTAELTKK